MNLDYKQKYLKYKNKYLLAKAQQGGVLTPEQNQIIELFLKKGNQELKNLMTIIGPKKTELTEGKIKLLIVWNTIPTPSQLPIGFQFKTEYDEQIKLTTDKINKEENEEESKFLDELKQELNKYKEAEIERMKRILYNKLLSTIFDDAVTIEQFTELANQPIE